ncbi:uncharacterized protein [Prorops nasuta]|uniref:uncharacterized protein n=1 Tax=Prorops nasuta TaxID=863751 RepID=UPI0034CF5DE1
MLSSRLMVVILGCHLIFDSMEASAGIDIPGGFETSAGMKKHRNEPEEFGQCSLATFWEEQLGVVNVYAFLDVTWKYSYKQTVMLKLLKERLEKNGFTDILFFVVAAPPDFLPDTLEEEIEKAAWKEISMLEQRELQDMDEKWIHKALKDSDPTELLVLHDNPELRIWEKFHASRDQILVIDRCGRLTYQVIVPWSILYFPYVKAAILSTYKEDPCGLCDLSPVANETNGHQEEEEYKPETTTELNLINTEIPEEYSIFESSFDDREDFNATESVNATRSSLEPVTFKFIDFDADGNSSSKGSDVEESPVAEFVTMSDLPDVTTTEINNFEVGTESVGRGEISSSSSSSSLVDAPVTQDSIKSLVPIRIIMRAPHVHTDGQRASNKENYLVLKTGDPNYHEHIKPGWNAGLQDDQNEDPRGKGKTENQRNITELAERQSTNRLIKFIYDKDESPGLYGEVADYWRNSEDDEESENNDNQANVTHTTQPSVMDENLEENYSVTESSTDFVPKSDEVNETEVNSFVKEDEGMEVNSADESRNKLLTHYNRLLPWIYYVLVK